jgi:hypothetical protein
VIRIGHADSTTCGWPVSLYRFLGFSDKSGADFASHEYPMTSADVL